MIISIGRLGSWRWSQWLSAFSACKVKVSDWRGVTLCLDFPFSQLGFQHGFYIIWYLSGRSGGAGSDAFAEQLSFWTAQGLMYVSILSLVMPLLSLVTVFVFQVDDSNADKNVSSAQIVGKSELETLKAQCWALCCFLIHGIQPHALSSLQMQYGKNRTQDFLLPEGKQTIFPGPKESHLTSSLFFHSHIFIFSTSLCSCWFSFHCAWKLKGVNRHKL